MKRAHIYLIIITLLSSCAVNKIVLEPGYFSAESRVGLMVVTNPIEYEISSPSGGLISIATAPSERYSEALKVLKKYLNYSEKVKDFFMETFKSKGKKILQIEENILAFDTKFNEYKIDHATLKDFQSPKGSSKKYFKVSCVDHFCKKDMRYLKDKFQIDELVIVFVKHGITIKYLYGAETDRLTTTFIDTEIVDLNDNSVIFKDEISVKAQCIEEWDTPPDYKNLRDGMYTSLEDALLILKDKLK